MIQSEIAGLLFTLLFVASCSTGPKKDLKYTGVDISHDHKHGLVFGYIEVPLDDFPDNHRKTDVVFKDTKTKKEFRYKRTQGSFYLKLPTGEYTLEEFTDGGVCSTTTGTFGGKMTMPIKIDQSHKREQVSDSAQPALKFTVNEGEETNLGHFLATCFEWRTKDKFRKEFTDFVKDQNYETFLPGGKKEIECGCKYLRKIDGKAEAKMKEELAKIQK
jgi:hypothetical protein